MNDGRASVRNHVHAAREWLGRAEDSLDREQNIKGDLNLMLAQAELTRAKETERPTAAQRLARQLLPAVAALLIVGGGWLAARGAFAPAKDAAPSPPVAAAPAVPEAIAKAAEEVPEAVPITPKAPEAPVIPAAPVVPATPEAPVIKVEPEPEIIPAQETAAPPPAAAQTARIPTEEMQRLMGSAGQMLRSR